MKWLDIEVWSPVSWLSMIVTNALLKSAILCCNFVWDRLNPCRRSRPWQIFVLFQKRDIVTLQNLKASKWNQIAPTGSYFSRFVLYAWLLLYFSSFWHVSTFCSIGRSTVVSILSHRCRNEAIGNYYLPGMKMERSRFAFLRFTDNNWQHAVFGESFIGKMRLKRLRVSGFRYLSSFTTEYYSIQKSYLFYQFFTVVIVSVWQYLYMKFYSL